MENKTVFAVEVNDLTVSYDETTAIENISFKVPKGQITGVIGPNGAGKSTLIKAIMGLLKCKKGSIKVFESSIKKARSNIAYVPQQNDIDLSFPISVSETVMMGRYPYLKRFKGPSKTDKELVLDSLKKVKMDYKKDRQIGELSGGERQRVFLARALSQNAELFFLDEPFSAIDFTSEEIITNLLTSLASQGKTLFVVHHDLKKASKYFDSILLINKTLVAQGKAKEVLNPENLEKAYQGKTTILDEQDEDILVVTE
ncbi:metal ABC transporter ATP-binding protein [Natranaerobius trueperi]|uniref:Manganese ABC transporter ATP-binding protein n=1 Tax=Natranaerobius trueperi TaxID=759412 RepID=A0A226C1E0_9FIRM|nr:metal ABC transporter ATP-binding protein [Natranaerobius trueperi]OWZ85001.1 manganese ABC transporter ATP-binding protein [Natranaerobius trueperi]